MDDYSKYIETPSEFIRDYQIKDEQIIVHTNKTKKRQPHIYKASKTKIKHYESRLEQQYKKLILKREDIIESRRDIKDIVYMSIAMTLCVLSAVSSDFSELLGMFLCGTGIFALILSAIDNAIFSYIFTSKVKLYELFLQERKKLEKDYESKPEIISQTNKRTLKIISHNQSLKDQELIDSVFNVNLMDKISLRELRNLLYQYCMSDESTRGIIDDNQSLKVQKYKERIKKRIKGK